MKITSIVTKKVIKHVYFTFDDDDKLYCGCRWVIVGNLIWIFLFSLRICSVSMHFNGALVLDSSGHPVRGMDEKGALDNVPKKNN